MFDSVFNELNIIASGSFGIVCKAINKNNNKIFAIKKVPINEHLKENALREITVLSKLKSDLIVKLESFWIENNYYVKHDKLLEKLGSSHNIFNKNNNLLLHIQMELCYKTLKEIIEILNKELNQKQSEIMTSLGYYISSELFIEILESVDYLHKQNVIHRDLKPNNILITYGSIGRFVKIADFGLATIHETKDQSHTKYIGTIRYAAPEVMRGRKYDTKVDIFSLGVIVQELFNIDINEPIRGDSDLEMNYSNLFDMIARMLSAQKNKRPDCEEILRGMNSWAFSLNQLIESTDLKKNTNKKSIEESFHMFFIQTKYNALNKSTSLKLLKNNYEYRSKSAIGIDLGTNYSCVGVMKRGKVHIISNKYGSKTTPSYISFKSNGESFVGQSAKEEAHENPANTIYNVQRMIGRNYNDIEVQNNMKLWPFDIIDENGSLKVKLHSEDHITYLPQQLSAEILSKLKNDAEKFLQFEVKSAVITVPAYFNDAQRQATKEAGTLAGLNVLQIINQPTAAAIAYNHQIKEDFRKNALIYDLGGGTFDVAVVIIENGIIDVKAVNGDTHLGGVDFDQRVLDFLYDTYKHKFSEAIDEEKQKRALHKLKINVEKKKWELSEMSSTNIIIDALLPGWDFKYELTRDTFDDLCIDLFEKTIKIIDETLKCARMEANEIDDIVLIGGSTKIPKIQTLLQKYFINKPLNNEMYHDEAVVYGATIQAALLNEETFIDSNRTLLHDVSPFSLGIELYDKTMFVIIPRNSKIPTVKSQTFQTVEVYIDSIQIYEGENKVAKENRLLGNFIIDGFAKKPGGEEKLDVTMEIDKQGILHVKAKFHSRFTDNPFDKATIRKNHNEYIKSCFDMAEDEDDLIQIYDVNMKLVIGKYIVGNYAELKKSEELIKQFQAELDEDFEALLTMFRIKRKVPESKHKQALESVKAFYVREMGKHFSKPKYILSDDLQALHENYKSLSHDKLREELSNRDIPKVSQQLNQSLEMIYKKFKRKNLSNSVRKHAIGIDLGTTYSCVGVMNRGKVHIISNTYGLKTTPSYISFPESGQEFVGQSAKGQAYENPANTIYDVKRMIGRNYNDIHIQEDMKLWPFEVVNEKSSLKVKLRNDDNISLYPEELSAKVLSRLKIDAENFLGFKVNNAVITVPAYFNDAQRQATKDAGRIAGLNVLQILNEPTAAAIAYNHQIREDFTKNVLFYDLGGGTFEVAVVIIENGIIDVKAIGGDTHLGGVDFDQRIMNHLFMTFEDDFRKGTDNESIKRAMARLRYRCEMKKWELSEICSTIISIDELLPGWDFKYTLERPVFEHLCIDLFKKTIVITEKTLKSADIKACDINDVVLIGGSTKIPKIQSLLREYFLDKSLNKEISPDEVVAYGATIQAALLNGETFIDSNRTLIRDVSPFSI